MPFPLKTGALTGTERIALYDEQGGNAHITSRQIADLVAAGGANIATADLQADGNYFHDWDGNHLDIKNADYFNFQTDGAGRLQLSDTNINLVSSDVGVKGTENNMIFGVDPTSTDHAYIRLRDKNKMEFFAPQYFFKDGNTVTLPSDNPALTSFLVVDRATGEWALKNEPDITQAPGVNLGNADMIFPAGPTTRTVESADNLGILRFRNLASASITTSNGIILTQGTGPTIMLMGQLNLMLDSKILFQLKEDTQGTPGVYLPEDPPLRNDLTQVLVRDSVTGEIGLNFQLANLTNTNLFDNTLDLQTNRSHDLQNFSFGFINGNTITLGATTLQLNSAAINMPQIPAIASGNVAEVLVRNSAGTLGKIDTADFLNILNIPVFNIATSDLIWTANRTQKGNNNQYDLVFQEFKEFNVLDTTSIDFGAGTIQLTAGILGLQNTAGEASIGINSSNLISFKAEGQNVDMTGQFGLDKIDLKLDQGGTVQTQLEMEETHFRSFQTGGNYKFGDGTKGVPVEGTGTPLAYDPATNNMVRFKPAVSRVYYDQLQSGIVLGTGLTVFQGNQVENSDTTVLEATTGQIEIKEDGFIDVSLFLMMAGDFGGFVEIHEARAGVLSSAFFKTQNEASVSLRWAGEVQAGDIIKAQIAQIPQSTTIDIFNFEFFART